MYEFFFNYFGFVYTQLHKKTNNKKQLEDKEIVLHEISNQNFFSILNLIYAI